MSRLGGSWARGLAAGSALVCAGACGGARPPASPNAAVQPAPKPATTAAKTPPARAPLPDPVQLRAAGAEPRQTIRYSLAGAPQTLLHSELVFFQPVYRLETTYGPVEQTAGGYELSVHVKLDTANSMLGMLGASLFAAAPACAASVRMDARGLLDASALLDQTCARIDATLLGLRQTSLHPAIPLPEAAIGTGARWQVSARPGEPPATYTLLDAEGGVLTVSGELEPTPRAVTSVGGAGLHAPDRAWVLARFSAGELMRSASVAWVPASGKPTKGVTMPLVSGAPSDRTFLVRINSVADGLQGARDDTKAALERALSSSDATVREAAVLACGVTNDWRLISRLLDLGSSEPALATTVNDSLGRLTGRTARGPEDWIDATAPLACGGELQRAEEAMTRGIAAGGAPEVLGRLLSRRGDVRRELGNVTGADQDYREAIAQSPSDPDVTVAVAWWLATGPDAKRRDGKKAIALLDAVKERDGTLMLFSQARAAALAEQRDFKAARALQESAGNRISAATELSKAEAEKRQQIARTRLDAYTHHKAWREPLITQEAMSCYRLFGLSRTLL